jgi:NADP-dependent 3-hydroxy acid dehydrogenase YdfG
MGHVLVTGATGGIGSAVVAALQSAGYQVTGLGRDHDRLQDLSARGARTISIDLDQIDDLGVAVGQFDELDALIHCAGVSGVASVGDTTPEQWKNTMTVNVCCGR